MRLFFLSMVTAGVAFLAGAVHEHYIERGSLEQLRGCREVLATLERPVQPVHIQRLQYVPGTRIYQDFEK